MSYNCTNICFFRKYVIIKDNSQWDVNGYEKKSFIEETEILEKNLDKEILEEDNSF